MKNKVEKKPEKPVNPVNIEYLLQPQARVFVGMKATAFRLWVNRNLDIISRYSNGKNPAKYGPGQRCRFLKHELVAAMERGRIIY
ncbi:MAG: hypothetical protein WCR72_12145 [Bacteroidota bacterium]